MRRRLIDNTLTFISALCVFQIVWDLLEDFHIFEWNNEFLQKIIKLSIAVFAVLVIVYQISCKKKLLVDAFDILKNLSQNNKLHVLREVVMVVNDEYEKSKNKFKIKSANFQYTIFKGDEKNIYDVKYDIQLNFISFFHRKNGNMLKFYAILDTNGHIVLNDIPISISFKTMDNSDFNFITLPKSATISALDHIDKFSGLYEISFRIPERMIKRFHINYIQCAISYTVKNNFSLTNKSGSCEYNFFIYPNNYGKRVNKCTVKVLVPENQNYSIVCHQFGLKGNAEKIFDCIQNGKQISQHRSYLIFSGSFRPQRNAAYFINLSKF